MTLADALYDALYDALTLSVLTHEEMLAVLEEVRVLIEALPVKTVEENA